MVSITGPEEVLRTIDTLANLARLERFFQIEKDLMLIQAAKLPELSAWTLKQRMGHHLYEDMLHAEALRRRRMELPGGRKDADEIDDALIAVIEACLHFPGDVVFCSAVYLGFKKLLIAAYRQHLEQTTSFSDYPGRSIIERIVIEEDRQIAWIEGAIALMPATPSERQEAAAAIAQVQGWVAAAGGILGAGELRPAELPELAHYRLVENPRRDARQKATFEFIAPTVADGIHPEVISLFTAFFREMAAAETVAGVLWDVPRNMPWEFFADTARHCWDEIRHCQVGQQRMETFGYDIWQLPVQTGNYTVRARMPVLERYAVLTQVQEKSAFAWKHENERRCRDAGDAVSAHMIAYDIADETAHVKFGVKWVPELQRALSDRRSFDDLVDASRDLWERTLAEARRQAAPPAVDVNSY